MNTSNTPSTFNTTSSSNAQGESTTSEPPQAVFTAKIRVMLVDDQVLLRLGLRTILETEDDITIVAEANSGDEALAILEGAAPDVILMDIQMPGIDGIATTARITAAEQHPAVVMLTTFHREDYLFAALRAGAVGFLLKSSPAERMSDAIRTAASGKALLDPDLTRQVIEAAVRQGPAEPKATALLATLTDREREVLAALAQGASNADLAAQLFIGETTVRTHLSSLFLKLGVANRVNAVIWAYRNGVAS
jgi:DNA-binding NarL/FixJ family response regulator